jgi:hypothetical protein
LVVEDELKSVFLEQLELPWVLLGYQGLQLVSKELNSVPQGLS